MSEAAAGVSVRHYAQFIGVIRARVAELGMTHETFDEIAGWAPGYASKVLCDPPMKKLGAFGMFIALHSVGLESQLSENAELVARIQSRLRKRIRPRIRAVSRDKTVTIHFMPDFLKQIRAKGGMARMSKLTPLQRSALARKANRARWSRVKAHA